MAFVTSAVNMWNFQLWKLCDIPCRREASLASAAGEMVQKITAVDLCGMSCCCREKLQVHSLDQVVAAAVL